MESTFLRGEFLPNRYAYIAQHEPMIFHCHHYNTFLQATIEDSHHYLDVYPILVDSAQEIAFTQFSDYFTKEKDNIAVTDFIQKKAIVTDFFRFCGFGKIDLSALSADGGEVQSISEHYSVGWLSKFGKRQNQDKGVSFFASGFLAGACEAIFGLALGTIDVAQTHCLTKGGKNSVFLLKKLNTPKNLKPSPKAGNFQSFLSQAPIHDHIDYGAIQQALGQMPIEGSEKTGLIDAFGVLLTRMYANYYCLISYKFLKILEKNMGGDGVVLATQLLTEAGHVCAFNTFGGVMESAEWHALIKPMITAKEDWVHGIVAVVNAFGWGKWEVETLIPNEKLVVKITSGYEANSFLGAYTEKSNYPISFLARGGTAGIMNLIYNGDITLQPTLDEVFYKKISQNPNRFVSTQIKCRAMGADFDVFEVVRL